MPSLEDMKRIADARTKCEWKASAYQVYDPDMCLQIADCFSTKNGNEDNNAKFIAMCGNNFDKLLKVVEAARNVLPFYEERVLRSIETIHGFNPYESTLHALTKAIDDLEKEE